jgi:hypothetical protein
MADRIVMTFGADVIRLEAVSSYPAYGYFKDSLHLLKCMAQDRRQRKAIHSTL